MACMPDLHNWKINWKKAQKLANNLELNFLLMSKKIDFNFSFFSFFFEFWQHVKKLNFFFHVVTCGLLIRNLKKILYHLLHSKITDLGFSLKFCWSEQSEISLSKEMSMLFVLSSGIFFSLLPYLLSSKNTWG